MNLSDPIVAALIIASATVFTTLIQLRMSWRREMRERERGQPITKKTRRGPVLFVFVLVIAAGVGGFALSQYFVSVRLGDQDTLRNELQARLTEISASAARLEQARMSEREQIETGARRAAASRQGEEGATASALVGPCKPGGGSGALMECTEKSAVRVAVCARVPEGANVKEVLLYIRSEDSQAAWSDARVQAGQDAGQARFSDKYVERPDTDATKQVCQGFVNWSADKSRMARVLVRYTP